MPVTARISLHIVVKVTVAATTSDGVVAEMVDVGVCVTVRVPFRMIEIVQVMLGVQVTLRVNVTVDVKSINDVGAVVGLGADVLTVMALV